MYAIDRTRSPHAVDQLVAMRMERQQNLTRRPHPLRFVAILDEAVLRRTVGGTATMRGQLDHLIDMASAPNVTLQVISFTHGAHNGMHGAFTLLHFNEEMTDSVAYVESQAGNLYQQKTRDVQRFTAMFTGLHHEALDTSQTLALIARIAKEL
jgi:hypothetical protein